MTTPKSYFYYEKKLGKWAPRKSVYNPKTRQDKPVVKCVKELTDAEDYLTINDLTALYPPPQEEGKDCKSITMAYTNYRGEKSIREIVPSEVPKFMATEFHPEPQWILRAWDCEKQDYRDFALRDCDFTVRLGEGES